MTRRSKRRLRWFVLGLAVAEAGWMAFDGGRALVVGDYVTVNGELGPWTTVVEALGVDPDSRSLKVFFLAYGVGWLALAGAYAKRVRWAQAGMAGAAAGSLWYLVFGTIASAAQLVLLAAERRSM